MNEHTLKTTYKNLVFLKVDASGATSDSGSGSYAAAMRGTMSITMRTIDND